MHTRIALSFAFVAALAAAAHAAQPATPDLLIAPTAKGADKIAITFDDKHIWLDSGSLHVVGQVAKGERPYRTASGETVALIKYEGNGFKLRDPSDKLLWKVKIDADSVKIADNEDMKNAWSIKIHGDHDKVLDAKDAEVGSVRAGDKSGKVKVKDAKGKEQFTVEIGKQTAGLGALLIKDIPQQQRDIIAAEIFLRGK